MREDELLPPPVVDTIGLLAEAARQAGFDVDPDVRHGLASAHPDLPAVLIMIAAILGAFLVALALT